MLCQELAHKNWEIITRRMKQHCGLEMKETEFQRVQLVSLLLQGGDVGAFASVPDVAVGAGGWTQHPNCK